jgi:hypothetical protein
VSFDKVLKCEVLFIEYISIGFLLAISVISLLGASFVMKWITLQGELLLVWLMIGQIMLSLPRIEVGNSLYKLFSNRTVEYSKVFHQANIFIIEISNTNTLDIEKYSESSSSSSSQQHLDDFTNEIYPDFMTIYEGNQDKGTGLLYFEGGMMYEGSWENDHFNGMGEMIFPDGAFYSGYWKDDLMDGKGFLIFSDDVSIPIENSLSTYEGDWRENCMHGKGALTLRDGSKYEGDFEVDLMTGFGKATFSDGCTFTGHWLDGNRSGKGIQNCPFKYVYEGDWKDDFMHGKGVLTFNDGIQYDGTWNMGKFDPETNKIRYASSLMESQVGYSRITS